MRFPFTFLLFMAVVYAVAIFSVTPRGVNPQRSAALWALRFDPNAIQTPVPSATSVSVSSFGLYPVSRTADRPAPGPYAS